MIEKITIKIVLLFSLLLSSATIGTLFLFVCFIFVFMGNFVYILHYIIKNKPSIGEENKFFNVGVTPVGQTPACRQVKNFIPP